MPTKNNIVRILLVEDEVNLCDLIRTGLQRSSPEYSVEATYTSEDAHELLKKQPFDILVTDIKIMIFNAL